MVIFFSRKNYYDGISSLSGQRPMNANSYFTSFTTSVTRHVTPAYESALSWGFSPPGSYSDCQLSCSHLVSMSSDMPDLDANQYTGHI